MNAITDVIDGKAFLRTETVGCPLCGTVREPRRVAARFGMTAMVAECERCRLGFQTPRPSEEACISYMDWRWSSSGAYVTDSEAKREAARRQFEVVARQVPTPGRLLDFGAGSGTFVRAALDAGWSAVGVEHSPVAIERAKAYYDVKLSSAWPEGRFDVVTLWDVVEHLKQPLALLARLRETLAPGGLIVIQTGNYESWMRLARGDRWGLYLLDHHYYFTPSSLEATLARAGFGAFRLLPADRERPSLARLFRRPGRAAREWMIWRRARRLWPEHAEIHEMLATARPSQPAASA